MEVIIPSEPYEESYLTWPLFYAYLVLAFFKILFENLFFFMFFWIRVKVA